MDPGWLVLAGLGAIASLLVAWGLTKDPARTGDERPPGRPLQARDGTWVASKGERRIANWLDAHEVPYRYEPEMAGGLTPDFHLEGTSTVIEYWGLASQDSYEDRMVEKIEQYEEHGIDVVSVFPAHLHEMGTVLEHQLAKRGLLTYDAPGSA